MSEEKKELINEELNDEKKELTQEELEQVNGGGAIVQVKGEDIAKLNTTEALLGKAEGVQIITTSGQPGSGVSICVR